MTVFASPRAHLKAELLRVQHWLRRYQQRHAPRYKPSNQGYLHAFVTTEEMADILNSAVTPSLQPDDNLALLRQQIDERVAASTAAGEHLPLTELRARLSLDQAGYDLVVALLAPEVSVDLQRAYRHAYADFTQKHGSWLFFVELLAEAGHSAAAVERWLRPGQGLMTLGVALLEATTGELADAPPSRVTVVAAPRLVSWATYGTAVQPRLSPAVERRGATDDVLVMPPDIMTEVMAALAWVRGAPRRRLLMVGPDGAGRRALVTRFEGALVALDVGRLPKEADARQRVLREVHLEARLADTTLYVRGLDSLPAQSDDDSGQASALDALLFGEQPLILGAERGIRALRGRLGHADGEVLEVRLPMPTGAQQRQIWQTVAPDAELLEPGVDFAQLVAHYSLTGGAMTRAVAAASAQAMTASNKVITAEAMTQALRNQLSHALGDLATRVSTHFERDDLVVEPLITQQLSEITALFRDRETLMTRWGFGHKMPYGRGLTVLFGGPPGTGKTMAAGVMAAELGLELFKVNLAQVTDKYIGETEKKLERIFDEAGRGQAILLFDEADSLFARRTEVTSSTDRYANAGVNYLLQRMESYDGITVLTTNLEGNLDPAFRRRIRFKLTFAPPNADQRFELWQSMLPAEAHLGGDIDVDELAEDYELVGADILGIIYKASARAVASNSLLTHELLLAAVEDLHRERGIVVRRRRSLFDDP
ncbi:MAG: ATP-binding protein [Myxococcales bacterium]|nr:ATP-binding protein [Myxococcales bacterium]